MSRRRVKHHPYPDLHQALVESGWEHRLNGGGHHSYSPPVGSLGLHRVTLPATPSDRRSYLNSRAALRRLGVT